MIENKDINLNEYVSSSIFSGKLCSKENTDINRNANEGFSLFSYINIQENRKIFKIYQYCTNSILSHKKDLCYNLFLNSKYKDHP